MDAMVKRAEDALECGDLDTADRLLEKAADFAGSLDRGTGHRVGIDHEHQPTTRRLEVSSATRAARPHEFDAKVAFVMDRDAVSKNEAMATARREYPDVYQAYQGFQASSPTNEQATRRGNYKIGKSTSPITYEDLVSDEMRKGCNMEVRKSARDATTRVCCAPPSFPRQELHSNRGAADRSCRGDYGGGRLLPNGSAAQGEVAKSVDL